MSKRFGRNQKRAMRLELQYERLRNELNERTTKNLQDRCAKTERLFNDMRSVLSENNFLCDAPEVASLTNRPVNVVEMLGCRFFGEECPQSQETITVHCLQYLNLDKFEDWAKGMMHIKASLAGKSVMYGLTDEAIYGMPKDVLVRRISSEMAEFLVKELRA